MLLQRQRQQLFEDEQLSSRQQVTSAAPPRACARSSLSALEHVRLSVCLFAWSRGPPLVCARALKPYLSAGRASRKSGLTLGIFPDAHAAAAAGAATTPTVVDFDDEHEAVRSEKHAFRDRLMFALVVARRDESWRSRLGKTNEEKEK